MRQQKDEELEQYKKEIERQKRFESQKGAQGAGIPEKVTVKRKVAAAASTGTSAGTTTGVLPKRTV